MAFVKASRHDMKLILGDFNGIIGRERTHKPTIRKHSKHTETSDDGRNIIDFA